MKKNTKIIIILCTVLAVLIAGFAIISKLSAPEIADGDKNITVTVVGKDGSDKEYSIKTDAEYLSDAMLEKKLLTQEEHDAGTGMYTVVDGLKADYNVDKSWWCITKGGEMTSVGMDEQPIADGDRFEITYTIS